MVAQIAAGAWAFHNKDKLDDIVRASVKYSVQEEYGQSSMSSRTVTFDNIQKNVSVFVHLCKNVYMYVWRLWYVLIYILTPAFVNTIYQVDTQISWINIFFLSLRSAPLQLKCCGADGPADWATSRFNNVDRTNIVDIAVSSMNVFYNIPESCCKDELKENVCEMSRKLKFGGSLNQAIYQQVCRLSN